MLISVVIPAFNAASVVERALVSIYAEALPASWKLEVIVVNDGSPDAVALSAVLGHWPGVRLVSHAVNRGMCAARNTGIAESKGDILIILDADDEFVPGWPHVFDMVLRDWPAHMNVCYVACRNTEGRSTVLEPEYEGPLTLEDILNERHAGEYLPVFRGDYVRAKGYVDLGMRKSCGVVSYIGYALDGPFWISKQVLRIYHDNNQGSVTSGWVKPEKAAETAECYQCLLERYGHLYQSKAPLVYRTKLLRLAVYRRFAKSKDAWHYWIRGASLSVLKETAGAALVLLIGPELGAALVSRLKKWGVIRRYG